MCRTLAVAGWMTLALAACGGSNSPGGTGGAGQGGATGGGSAGGASAGGRGDAGQTGGSALTGGAVTGGALTGGTGGRDGTGGVRTGGATTGGAVTGGTGGTGGAGGGTGGTGGAGGADAGTYGDAPSSGPCPSTPPTEGATCDCPGLVCEYFDDVRRRCHTIMACGSPGPGVVWRRRTNICGPAQLASCPDSREAAAGQACAVKDAGCLYERGLRCLCTNCEVGPVGDICQGPLKWRCEVPNPDVRCPVSIPPLGSPCTSEGLTCTYECEVGGRICRNGIWVNGAGDNCPKSTRAVKQDIRYLGEADLARIARDLQAIRLATFRYTDPVLARRERLGFIIEDNPAPYAIDRERNAVDVYGYASMLLAASQVQAREIRALRAEVTALRRQMEGARLASPRATGPATIERRDSRRESR